MTLALPRDTELPLGKNSARKIIDTNVRRGAPGGKNRERITLQVVECCFCHFSLECRSALAREWGQTNEFIYSLGWLTEWKGHTAQEDFGSKPQLTVSPRTWHFQDFFYFFILWVLWSFFFVFLLSQNINWAAVFSDKTIPWSLSSSLLDLQILSRHFFFKSPDFKLFFEAELNACHGRNVPFILRGGKKTFSRVILKEVVVSGGSWLQEEIAPPN